ncbi:MAG: hypothetical protein ABS944_08775 [Solibacillus sp.]|uniref:hypothetical protein n=1 Tax=Solibacillus sp. TaxID=1909654 RepID=UPI003315880D
MRIAAQAVVGSLLLHIVYVVIVLAIGYIQTVNYRPEFLENVTVLQSEVAFSFSGSTVTLLNSFIFVTLVLGAILLFRKSKAV